MQKQVSTSKMCKIICETIKAGKIGNSTYNLRAEILIPCNKIKITAKTPLPVPLNCADSIENVAGPLLKEFPSCTDIHECSNCNIQQKISMVTIESDISYMIAREIGFGKQVEEDEGDTEKEGELDEGKGTTWSRIWHYLATKAQRCKICKDLMSTQLVEIGNEQ